MKHLIIFIKFPFFYKTFLQNILASSQQEAGLGSVREAFKIWVRGQGGKKKRQLYGNLTLINSDFVTLTSMCTQSADSCNLFYSNISSYICLCGLTIKVAGQDCSVLEGWEGIPACAPPARKSWFPQVRFFIVLRSRYLTLSIILFTTIILVENFLKT